MRRLLREPLVHFLLIGAVLYGAYAYRQHRRGVGTSPYEIRLTLDDLAQLEIQFESKWYRQPTMQEFNNLVEDRVREEVLYREALTMGLNKDDTIVRRRMAQKMKFLAQDVAASTEPTTEELRAWFRSHTDLFAYPPRASFRHLYFSADRGLARARTDAEAALSELAGEPIETTRVDEVADPFMFQDYYGGRGPQEIARDFGPEFARETVTLAPGFWQGPVQSGLGWHLVFVESITPGRIPAFEEVEPEVRTAWLGEQKEEAWQKAYDEMRAKYTILLPAPPVDPTVAAADDDFSIMDAGALPSGESPP